jgi:photosystem II stability/assembly factor-like uncharacterized protein
MLQQLIRPASAARSGEFLAGQAAVWRTSDGGRTWTLLPGDGLGLTGGAGQLTFQDRQHGVLFVQLGGGGTPEVLATADGGATWRPAVSLASPLPGTSPLTVALVQHGHRLLAWLVTLPADEIGPQGRLVQVGPTPHLDMQPYLATSDDGGQTWGPLVAGPAIAATYVAYPVIDQRGRLKLVAGRSMYVSDDDGATWTTRVVQAPADEEPAFLYRPRGDVLLAAAGGTRAVSQRYIDGLLRSTDGGAHWDRVSLPR